VKLCMLRQISWVGKVWNNFNRSIYGGSLR
jgi:hypothetical protein